ncbi:MAG: hypothetical protein J7527_10750 [Chitinophagaceae bacterium]|nr:hypothetical protein [Chitinophagaceae bacterium]
MFVWCVMPGNAAATCSQFSFCGFSGCSLLWTVPGWYWMFTLPNYAIENGVATVSAATNANAA